MLWTRVQGLRVSDNATSDSRRQSIYSYYWLMVWWIIAHEKDSLDVIRRLDGRWWPYLHYSSMLLSGIYIEWTVLSRYDKMLYIARDLLYRWYQDMFYKNLTYINIISLSHNVTRLYTPDFVLDVSGFPVDISKGRSRDPENRVKFGMWRIVHK